MVGNQNRVKRKIQEGKIALGFVCRTLSPVVVELIGLSGFDFVWIDMEHTSADFATVEHLCRAADATGIESLVRVPDKNASNILRALEAGAGIINVPQVEERGEAEAVVKAAKYYPRGERGYCSSSRGTMYGLGGEAKDVFAAANERVMTMVQIESIQGVENASEICSVADLDMVFIGLADLSQCLGVVGQLGHPDVVGCARKVLDAIRAKGKLAAMLADTVENAKPWLAEGVNVVCCGVDTPTMGRALLRIQKDFSPLQP